MCTILICCQCDAIDTTKMSPYLLNYTRSVHTTNYKRF